MTTVERSKRRVLVNSLSGVVTLVLNLSFILWLYQYLLSRIPPEEFAIYPVLIVVMTLVPVLASFFASGLSRGIVAAYTAGEPKKVTALHSSTVLMLTIALPVFLGLGGLAAWKIESLITVPEGGLGAARLMLLLLTGDIALSVFGVPFSTAFEAKQRFIERDAIQIVGNVLRISLTFLLLFNVSTEVLWIPVASVLSNSIVLLLIVWRSRRIAVEYRVRRSLFSFETVRGLLSFGFWTSMGTISMLLYHSSGPILLNRLSTPDQVNSFFIGSVIDRRISGIMTVALAPVVPFLTSMSVSGDFTRLGNTYLRGGRYALWTSLAIACPLFVFADDFIGLYLDETYAETATVMMILLATFPFTYPDVMLSRIAIATAKLKQFFAGALVSTIITVIVAVVALKNSDTGAVTLALVFSGANVIVHLAFFWPLGLRLARISVGAFVRQTLVPGLLPAVVGSLVWWGLSLAFGAATWLALFVNSLVGGLVYIAVLLRFCLQSDEQQSLRRLRQRAGLRSPSIPSAPEPRS